jgi:sugar phosphate isomerase/epimerase
MTAISRRDFVRTAVTSAAAATLFAGDPMHLKADPLGLPIGCQTWPVRAWIAKDLPGTLKQLADAGFKSVELCSPFGYQEFGFGGLSKYSGAELKKILSDAGLTCISSHFGIKELRENQDRSIAWAKDVGLTQMLVPSLDGPKNPTMDDIKRAADEYNKIGEKAAKAGIQQGLHNEEFEMSTVDGKPDGERTYDLLLAMLDPKLVKFQFQISTISRGFDVTEYFSKYPGRFISMHVQDWSSETKKIVPVGQGTLNWKAIFGLAKIAGIKNYFVEMNLEMMKASVPYLHQLQV